MHDGNQSLKLNNEYLKLKLITNFMKREVSYAHKLQEEFWLEYILI